MSSTIALNTLNTIYNNSFKQYLRSSNIIGGVVFEQSQFVDRIFKATLDLIEKLTKYRKPVHHLDQQTLLEPILSGIEQVVDFESIQLSNDVVFHITLICKSVKIFEWVQENDAEKFVAKLHKYVQFYQQKAQGEVEDLGITHFEWLNYWTETYEEFSIFIVNFYKHGLTWSGEEILPGGFILGDADAVHRIETRQAILNDINNVSVQESLLTHHESSQISSQNSIKTFKKDDNKWIIQNQKDSHKDLVLNAAKKDDNILISQCEDCTIVIQNIVNTISIERCKRITVLFKYATKLEVNNSDKCNFHCFEKLEILYMKSCENSNVYLSDKYLDASIITTKCSGIQLNFPFDDGVYHNFTISDQLKTKILLNKGIETVVTSSVN